MISGILVFKTFNELITVEIPLLFEVFPTIAIGNGATANGTGGDGSIAIGKGSIASGNKSIAIGINGTTAAGEAIVIGDDVDITGSDRAIALGNAINISGAADSITIGTQTDS